MLEDSWFLEQDVEGYSVMTQVLFYLEYWPLGVELYWSDQTLGSLSLPASSLRYSELLGLVFHHIS